MADHRSGFRTGDVCEICNLIDALGRHPELGPFEELAEIFEGVEYSYARRRAATVMAASDPTFTSRFARECLWDCESETQEIGQEFVDSSDLKAVARVEEISTSRLAEAAAHENYRALRDERKAATETSADEA